MFILRRITSEGNQLNDCIGERYHKVMQETQKEEFEKALKAMKWSGDPELYGFVIYSSSDKQIHYPLYKKSVYFMMTESGKTFDNLTFRF